MVVSLGTRQPALTGSRLRALLHQALWASGSSYPRLTLLEAQGQGQAGEGIYKVSHILPPERDQVESLDPDQPPGSWLCEFGQIA